MYVVEGQLGVYSEYNRLYPIKLIETVIGMYFLHVFLRLFYFKIIE